MTFKEYAKPIYANWDKVGKAPPEGYKSWVEYLEKMPPEPPHDSEPYALYFED